MSKVRSKIFERAAAEEKEKISQGREIAKAKREETLGGETTTVLQTKGTRKGRGKEGEKYRRSGWAGGIRICRVGIRLRRGERGSHPKKKKKKKEEIKKEKKTTQKNEKKKKKNIRKKVDTGSAGRVSPSTRGLSERRGSVGNSLEGLTLRQ